MFVFSSSKQVSCRYFHSGVRYSVWGHWVRQQISANWKAQETKLTGILQAYRNQASEFAWARQGNLPFIMNK